MSLSAGIVGLPNVGKSTLFNAITNSQVEAANYPFATINPNVGIVKVKDERLENLAKLFNPEKLVYATCTFVDIAGLVKGASQGEGLGNQFLSNIREVDAICHVVRCFDDKNITHVHNEVNPVNDAEIINLELIIADLQSMEKRVGKIIAKAKSGDKQAAFEASLCQKIIDTLKANKFVKSINFNEEEKNIVKNYNLLTNKPMLYIANVNESDISNPFANKHYLSLKKYIEDNQTNDLILPISINLEYEISTLDESDKKLFLEDLNIKSSGLDLLVRKTYELLNLQTYFTFGKKETRAWTFIKGMTAPECAGIIHTDFKKGFIRVEVYHVDDLIKYKSEFAAKENGKLRIEGKEYLMQDGDVCLFRFNV